MTIKAARHSRFDDQDKKIFHPEPSTETYRKIMELRENYFPLIKQWQQELSDSLTIDLHARHLPDRRELPEGNSTPEDK